MNLGIYVNNRNPKSKKAIKEAFKADPNSVHAYATGLHDKPFEGKLTNLPDGQHYFVGPDPYTSRVFYGQIIKRGYKITIK